MNRKQRRSEQKKGRSSAQEILPAAQESFDAALHEHKRGKLNEAERLYRRVLAAHPRHAETLHMLGVIAAQRGQHDPAIDLIGRAIAINAKVPQYHNNLGNVLREQGRLDAAVACYRKAIELQPETAAAHNNLGIALMHQGRLDAAIACYRTAIERTPRFAEAYNNLGNALREQGRPDAAIAAYRMSIERAPHFLKAHANLGKLLQEQGRLEEAVACYREAIERAPDLAETRYSLGNLLRKLGRKEEAIACYREAIERGADDPEVPNTLGNMLREQGRLEEAIDCLRKAIEAAPHYPPAHNSLGVALQVQGRLTEARACYQKAIELRPEFPEAHNNLGNALQEQGQLDAAIACYRTALHLRPEYPDACNNLALALAEQGRFDEAITCYRKSIELRPAFPEAHNNLGAALQEQGRLDEAITCYRRSVELRPDCQVFSNLLFTHNYLVDQPADRLRDMARQFGGLASGRADRAFTAWPFCPSGQTLRVGLVSGDLRNHPVGYFLEGLLRAADPARIAFIAFPSDHRNDALTARIRSCCTGWQPIHGLGDAAAARLIHAQGVQVLLDLSGHTRRNRLPVFAWRPAPVQASWLGYFATTGLAEMDYIIGDPQVTPPAEFHHFTETVWPLPQTYLCFTPPDVAVDVSALPSLALAGGGVTFGCCNNLTKLNDAVLAVWAGVLRAVPGSLLMLKAKQLSDGSVRSAIRARFAAHGIGEDRLLVEPPSSRAEYLRAYHRIDIALDPFPYPGGTTSCEALWMGVPVLTRRGSRFLSHAGETIARNAGLPDWIAADDDDYVARAAGFAADLGRLAALRARLRAQLLASPLCDAPRFARHFEDAMWGMWNRRTGRQGL